MPTNVCGHDMYKRKIAVNTRFLLSNKLEGIGWFTYETLLRMTNEHPDTEFHFFFDRPYASSFIFSKNIVPHVLFPPARHPFLWYLWFEWAVYFKLKEIKPDLFLSTDGHLCLRTKVPSLLVIHDLAFEHYPQFIGKIASWYYRYFTPLFARKAKMIATVSNFSKNDIIEKYEIAADKIVVVPNGANVMYQPIEPDEIKEIKDAHTNGQAYFLYVGAIHPRKNVKNIFLAFDEFKKSTQSEMKLVIVGRKAWQTDDTEITYEKMQFKNEVIFTGHLLPEELRKIIGAAFCLVYVSIFEGFGIPIVEAMSCRVPVITSNITSMPEVAGDACLLVNPLHPHEISKAMQKMVEDDILRQACIENGARQALKFNWNETTQKLWAAMMQILQAAA